MLFESQDRVATLPEKAPDFFSDLNFDQIVAAITASKEEYELTRFFYVPLHDADAVTFRHHVMQDLEDAGLRAVLKAFALSMRTVREYLAQLEKRYYEHQKERWFLDAVQLYGDAVNRLVQDLSAAKINSRGLRNFTEYLGAYASSEHFASLVEEAKRLGAELSKIRYNVFIRGVSVEIRGRTGESDYSRDVAATFARFQRAAGKEYAFKFSDSVEMNHVEAKILDGVAYLNQDTFSELEKYRAHNQQFRDPTIVKFDREIQFYIAYLEYIAPLKEAGLDFCYPRISDSSEEVYDYRGFDLALASKLICECATPVCNDFYLKGPERIIVVSGPNQGGKTTFARTFGQLHYLASLGLPVPGTRAQLYLSDQIFVHFERQEDMTTLRGKLEDDIIRIYSILEAATPRSIIIVNEIFASTALRDAIFLSKEIATAISELDAFCVWVTFLEEIAALNEKMVSMVSTVVPDNPAQRTFRIIRQPADGFAYAMSIAEKYRLTYEVVKERLGS